MKPLLLPVAQAGFVILTLIYFFFLVKEFRAAISRSALDAHQRKKLIWQIVIGLVVWGVFICAWSLSGVMSNFSIFPLNIAPVMLIPLAGSLILIFTRPFTEISRHISVGRLASLQSFRFFVELLLWALLTADLIPVQMTFEGRNLDILSGITGPIVGYLAMRDKLPKAVLIVWNIFCLGLLFNILGVAILSMPGPLRMFENEPANTIVGQFPIALLPAFLVPLAYILHFLSLRKLLLPSLESL